MKFEELKTPCYIIREEEYKNNIDSFMREFGLGWGKNLIFGYSIKTNHFPYLMQVAKEKGWYAESVSVAEYRHAQKQGFDEKKMILNGPQKGDLLIEACKAGVIVNLDSLGEVKKVCEEFGVNSRAGCNSVDGSGFESGVGSEARTGCCSKTGSGSGFSCDSGSVSGVGMVNGKLHVGLRVNFDLESVCPGETTCGNETTRFGICYENGDLGKAVSMLREAGIYVEGLHMHASSSSRSLKIFEALAEQAVKVAKEFDLDLSYVDIGGGFFGGSFFPGKPKVGEYAKVITSKLREYFDPEKVTLIVEPGAGVLATAVDYLTSVLSIRQIRGTEVVTMDGTCLHVNHFMKKQATPCTLINDKGVTGKKQVIGGNTCMEMDRFYLRDHEESLGLDSKVLFHCAGAYTMTHNGCFINTLPRVYVQHEGGEYEMVRDEDYGVMGL